MTKGKKAVIALAVLVVVALVSGLTTLAVTNYGSQSDPLVTLSYLNETVTPAIKEEINRAIDQKVTDLTNSFNAALAQNGGSATAPAPSTPSAGVSAGFVVVTLSNGQTVTCGVGTELMLRIGSAVSAGPDSPRLVDETDGSSVSAEGAALTANHLYMATISGNGVKATADNTKILISGDYSIG